MSNHVPPSRRNFIAIIALLAIGAAILTFRNCQKPVHSETAVYTQTVYLVRHAEKQKGDNPGLTEAGHARAEALKDLLLDKGVTHIYSTNYKRTLETAKPLAAALGLDVNIYDGHDLPTFSKQIHNLPGVHLVVGHSNTTPQLASYISGQKLNPMPETEYNRFIQIGIERETHMIDHKETTYGAYSDR